MHSILHNSSRCIYAMIQEARGRRKISLCAFCRVPTSSSVEEEITRLKKLVEADNAYAFYTLGGFFDSGVMGMPQDWSKANEFYLKV